MRSLLRFALLAALLLSVVRGFAQTPEPPKAGLRVMSFNLRYATERDGENQWKNRLELCTAAIRDFDPDLLGTQEVLAGQYDDLRRLFPDYTPVGVARDDGDRKGEWSAILWKTARFEQLAGGTFWLSATPEVVASNTWQAACTRVCTWVRLRDRTNGRVLLYANTHFDHVSALARLESARLLATRLPALAEGGPLVLTGDFNCTEDDPAHAALVAAGLADSYRAAHPERTKDEATFHAFKSTTAGSRIDWILHSPAFRTRAAEIVRSTGPRPVSDHYPVTAILEWKP